jgi:hypothetical protein
MSFQMFVHTVDTKGTLQSSVLPTAANDLSNKSYVDTAIAEGGGDWEASVIKQDSTPPGAPSSGDRYLVIATASGAWSGKESEIAEYDGSSWAFTAPTKGTHVYDEDSGNALIYNGTAWVVLANATGALIKTNNLSDLASAGTARTNLGLGTLAEVNSVSLTGSQVSGTLPVGGGGTGSTTASNARTALGVSIGTDVQAYSLNLTLIDAVTSSDGVFVVGSATGWTGESGSTARDSLSLGTGDSPQFTALNIGAATDTTLARSGAGDLTVEGKAIYREDGTDVPIADGGTGASNATLARSNLGLTIGTNIQAYSLSLSQIGNLSPSSDDMLLYSSGAWESKGASDVKSALSLGTAADATIATALASTGGNLLKVKSGTNLSSGDILSVNADGVIIAGSAGGTGTVTSLTPGADSGTGTAITTSGTIKIEGDGGAISTAVSGTDVTISAGDASTSTKGVAKFSSDNFTVSSGEVTIKSGGVDLAAEVTGTLPAGNGGTGLTSTATLLNSNVTPTSLGLVIGTNTQAYDADLTAIAALAKTDGNFIVGSGTAWVAETGAAARTSLGVAIGTDVQAYSLNLSAIGSLSPSDGDTVIYSGSAWDKTAYGEFTEPVRLHTSVPTVGATGTAIAPTYVSTAYELYILDLSSATDESTVELPAPAAGDVGKSIEVKVMGSMVASGGSANRVKVTVKDADEFDGLDEIYLEQDYQRLKFTVMQAGSGVGSAVNAYSLG